ncbi:IPT/TIG domain-containing protein [Pedobacter sp. Du54]|uniref:IPT/TIG domain-containing protein n=1 Tax=Pedobacter anseongensis TaxID=3133439 RepID=UPI00309AD5FC
MNTNRISKMVLLMMSLTLLIIASCKKTSTENQAAPTITSVINLTDRGTPLSQVDYGAWIIIKGENLATTTKVDFNGTLAADSLRYATDDEITVKIPSTLKDPINNPITVTTKYGTVTYNFKILQPLPLITGFNPAAGAPNDEITINGDYFKGVTEVRFDNTVATIVSSTQTEIKVKIPAGVTSGYIYATTPVGTAKSADPFGLKVVIFDDALGTVATSGTAWSNTSYSSTWDMNQNVIVRRGTTAIGHKYSVGFGAFRVRSIPTFTVGESTMLKISIYGGPGTAGKKVRISLTPTKSTYQLVLTEGVWTDYIVPLVNLGSPTVIDYITFQEFSGFAGQIYIDDIGFY